MSDNKKPDPVLSPEFFSHSEADPATIRIPREALREVFGPDFDPDADTPSPPATRPYAYSPEAPNVTGGFPATPPLAAPFPAPAPGTFPAPAPAPVAYQASPAPYPAPAPAPIAYQAAPAPFPAPAPAPAAYQAPAPYPAPAPQQAAPVPYPAPAHAGPTPGTFQPGFQAHVYQSPTPAQGPSYQPVPQQVAPQPTPPAAFPNPYHVVPQQPYPQQADQRVATSMGRVDTILGRAPAERATRPAALAHDILRTVVDLAGSETIRPTDLASHFTTAIDTFRKQALEIGYNARDVDEMLYALAAFIDETIIGKGGTYRETWASRPLQLTLFQQNNAGEGFFQRLSILLRDRARADVFEVYAIVLLLGFRGKFSMRSGDSEFEALLDDVRRTLATRGGSDLPLSPEPYVAPPTFTSVRLPWVVWASVAALSIFSLLYVGLRVDLALRVSNLLDSSNTSATHTQEGE